MNRVGIATLFFPTFVAVWSRVCLCAPVFLPHIKTNRVICVYRFWWSIRCEYKYNPNSAISHPMLRSMLFDGRLSDVMVMLAQQQFFDVPTYFGAILCYAVHSFDEFLFCYWDVFFTVALLGSRRHVDCSIFCLDSMQCVHAVLVIPLCRYYAGKLLTLIWSQRITAAIALTMCTAFAWSRHCLVIIIALRARDGCA